jgi:hypothetical protein
MTIDMTKPELYEFSDGTPITRMRRSIHGDYIAVRRASGPPWVTYTLEGVSHFRPDTEPTIVLKKQVIDLSTIDITATPLRSKCGVRVTRVDRSGPSWRVVFDRPVERYAHDLKASHSWLYTSKGTISGPVAGEVYTCDLEFDPTASIDWDHPEMYQLPCGARVILVEQSTSCPGLKSVDFDRAPVASRSPGLSQGFIFNIDGTHNGGAHRAAYLPRLELIPVLEGRYQVRGSTVVDGGVVVATCGSTDQAVEIAKGLNG